MTKDIPSTTSSLASTHNARSGAAALGLTGREFPIDTHHPPQPYEDSPSPNRVASGTLPGKGGHQPSVRREKSGRISGVGLASPNHASHARGRHPHSQRRSSRIDIEASSPEEEAASPVVRPFEAGFAGRLKGRILWLAAVPPVCAVNLRAIWERTLGNPVLELDGPSLSTVALQPAVRNSRVDRR